MDEAKRNKTRKKVKIDAVETIRKRLGLTFQDFSQALGFEKSSYNKMTSEGHVTETVALAAEALMRRQAAAGDVAFLVRVVKGAPRVEMVEGLEEMKMGGRTYLLVPV